MSEPQGLQGVLGFRVESVGGAEHFLVELFEFQNLALDIPQMLSKGSHI